MREPTVVDFFDDRADWGLAPFAVNSNSLAEMMAAGPDCSDQIRAPWGRNSIELVVSGDVIGTSVSSLIRPVQ
jgi:hypothetical protein